MHVNVLEAYIYNQIGTKTVSNPYQNPKPIPLPWDDLSIYLCCVSFVLAKKTIQFSVERLLMVFMFILRAAHFQFIPKRRLYVCVFEKFKNEL